MNADTESQQRRLLTLAASASVATALVLIAVKTVAWMMTGSVSLLASLVDSVMDSLASLMTSPRSITRWYPPTTSTGSATAKRKPWPASARRC